MGLVDIKAVESEMQAMSSRDTGSLFIDNGDDLVGGGGTIQCNGKIIDLVANQHEFTIDFPVIQVWLMGGRLEIQFITFKNTNNHFLP